MLAIVSFFAAHWLGSAFVQSFFLHRYGAHGQFRMSRGWERFFYLLTYLVLGSSFLPPRAYALLHRAHHAYSDTSDDPHSPHHRGPLAMMLATRRTFDGLANRTLAPEPRFEGNYPEWRRLDQLGWWIPGQVAWVCAYALFYIAFAPTPWLLLLLPIHALMGPIHGFLVNWCGHRYGYRNFDITDRSRNVLPLELLVMGEMMQNNHHRHPMRTSFAVRRFELDPTGVAIRALTALGIVTARRSG